MTDNETHQGTDVDLPPLAGDVRAFLQAAAEPSPLTTPAKATLWAAIANKTDDDAEPPLVLATSMAASTARYFHKRPGLLAAELRAWWLVPAFFLGVVLGALGGAMFKREPPTAVTTSASVATPMTTTTAEGLSSSPRECRDVLPYNNLFNGAADGGDVGWLPTGMHARALHTRADGADPMFSIELANGQGMQPFVQDVDVPGDAGSGFVLIVENVRDSTGKPEPGVMAELLAEDPVVAADLQDMDQSARVVQRLFPTGQAAADRGGGFITRWSVAPLTAGVATVRVRMDGKWGAVVDYDDVGVYFVRDAAAASCVVRRSAQGALVTGP